MSILLTRATHFNYRTNLTGALVSQLSRRSWSADSQLCADSLIEVLKRDLGGEVSLEVVRLLNRMIKERHYKINAKVLNILLHLRLKDELGGRRSGTVYADRVKKDSDGVADKKKFQSGKAKAKPRDVRKGKGEHLSKTQVKKMREVKEAERDMKEAEAEIDKEERDRNQTETLKLLFVLYFSILKADEAPAPFLGAALEGLARFAHRVNVDFFRDLLAVLRKHVEEARANAMARNAELLNGLVDDDAEEGGEGGQAAALLAQEPVQDDLRKALLCLVTAFELLSGQGEALNIDLSDMVAHLYSVMLPLCSSPSIEEVPIVVGQSAAQTTSSANAASSSQGNTHLLRTDADLLLRAVDLCLLRPRLSELPSERSAAFVKRMLVCALYTPANTTLRLLGVVRSMIGKDPKLEALLDTEDRAKNGRYDPLGEDVEAARPLGAGEVAWELHLLAQNVNEDVAVAAAAILAWQS
jgi:nucleolar complex protein 3